MSAYEIEAYNEIISDIYYSFTSKVAEGRGLSAEQVEEVARGRVWSGNDALEIGLVDEIGNLETALNYTKTLIESPDAETVFLPEIGDPFEMFMEDLTGVRSSFDALALLGEDNATFLEILSVKRMLESNDIYQTRLPFTLHFND